MPPDEAPAPQVPPSSRLCVKNIPKYIDEARLKDIFSAKGEVTDVKVLRTKDGRSRQLGFIGFKSVDEAAAALRYYNRSYMDTAKLEVEFARKVGDEQLPRAWSKHTSGTTANRKLVASATASAPGAAANGKANAAAETKQGAKSKKGGPLPEEEDPKLQEFLALMQPRSKARIWANDEMRDVAAAAAAVDRQPQAPKQKRVAAAAAGRGRVEHHEEKEEEEDEEEEAGDQYQDWTDAAVRVGGGGSADGGSSDDVEEGQKEDAEEGGDQEMASGSDAEGEDVDVRDGGGGGRRKKTGRRDEVVVNEGISDLDYLRSRMRRWDESSDDDGDAGGGGGEKGDQGRGDAKTAAAAAARGDQTGVSTSPRCEAAAGVAAGKKAAVGGGGGGRGGEGGRGGGKEETPPEKHGRRRLDGGSGAGGSAKDREDHGVHDEEIDVDMAAASPPPPPRNLAAGMAKQAEEEGILDTGRLFVRNLAYTATETDLSDLFGAFGDLGEVHLVVDRETKRSKGLAYVQYRIPEDAVRAARQLDGTIYQGRLLHILPAKRPPGSNPSAEAAGPLDGGGDPGDGGGDGDGTGGGADAGAGVPPGTSSFKAKREAQRKADAGNRAAWNTLFMRPDTVADAVAAHYGLSKAALLDASSAATRRGGEDGEGARARGTDSVAVRMALGEAQVIAATKQALAEAGVSVEALERAAAASGKASATRSVPRSGTTLLVKNLPYSADEDELVELFGRCGPLSRLVLPPARALALVEFTEPQDARAAFRSLAYKKYHHVPLYLEWAPADVFTAPLPLKEDGHQHHHHHHHQHQQQATKAAKKLGNKVEGSKAGAAAAAAAAAVAADGDDVDDGGGAAANTAVLGTIYVKNLAFSTTDAALRKHFDSAVSAVGGSLHSALVARKKAGKDGGTVQSLGYGFVEVDSGEVAVVVIKRLQGSMLDGHKLTLQLSRGRKSFSSSAAPSSASAAMKGDLDGGSTKLAVRNLAFEATKKDIQGLFNPFGHLKSCRLPKKFDGSHRGFAFVEFVTKQEARSALEGVAGTHLYGRRLVVEYAREDDTLDDIRNKTATKFKRDGDAAAGDVPAKRLKVL